MATDGTLDVKEGVLYWKHSKSADPKATGRPPLIFLHAGVADHTLWDAQIAFFNAKGWDCLTYDRFGFGRSVAGKDFLGLNPRPAIDHVEHLKQLIEHVPPSTAKVIVIGLSMGGVLAFDVVDACPELVCGMACIAGGANGFFDADANAPDEAALFAQHDQLIAKGDVPGAAALQVRIWGDGPTQPEGRLARPLAEKMLAWNLDIEAREADKTGGFAFEMVERQPRLDRISIPTALGYGIYDEICTTASMKKVAEAMPHAIVKAFKAAHMINLECEDELNEWLSAWLNSHFAGEFKSDEPH